MVNFNGYLGPKILGEPSSIINGPIYQQELDFWLYHQDNPDIYRLFKRYAAVAINNGHRKLSPWLIINRIRWEQEVMIKTDEAFKISNKYIAYYSRMWMKDYEWEKFFDTRIMLGEYLDDEL
jgi:hypothetical protein